MTPDAQRTGAPSDEQVREIERLAYNVAGMLVGEKDVHRIAKVIGMQITHALAARDEQIARLTEERDHARARTKREGDLVELLTRERDTLRADLKVVREALRELNECSPWPPNPNYMAWMEWRRKHSQALARLSGQPGEGSDE